MNVLSKLAIFVCTFIGASTIVVAEPLVKLVPPLTLLALRFFLAAALLGVALPKKIFPITKGEFLFGAITAAGFGIGCMLIYLVIPHIHAGRIAFLISLEIVIVPILCHWLFKQSISKIEKVATVPALIGLWLISGDETTPFSVWDLLALLSAFAYSIYTISLSHSPKDCRVTSRTFVCFLCISLLGLVSSFLFEAQSSIIWTWQTVASLAYLVLIGSFLRFLLQGWGQRQVSASFTALLFTAEPVFSIMLSYTFLAERFSTTQTIGAVLILVALGISNISPPKEVTIEGV